MARRSGFCTEKPRPPRMRQICVWPNLTPYSRSARTPTRLSVHSSVPKPCAFGLCSNVRPGPAPAPHRAARAGPVPASRAVRRCHVRPAPPTTCMRSGAPRPPHAQPLQGSCPPAAFDPPSRAAVPPRPTVSSPCDASDTCPVSIQRMTASTIVSYYGKLNSLRCPGPRIDGRTHASRVLRGPSTRGLCTNVPRGPAAGMRPMRCAHIGSTTGAHSTPRRRLPPECNQRLAC